jgi:hypothetical protein
MMIKRAWNKYRSAHSPRITVRAEKKAARREARRDIYVQIIEDAVAAEALRQEEDKENQQIMWDIRMLELEMDNELERENRERTQLAMEDTHDYESDVGGDEYCPYPGCEAHPWPEDSW